ncbi:hypothetical protein L596_029738 [Steinernema carpocapsae]|uniref:Uncharacterized protein n=1 Tax=Steinernema carpocapsae TaxID=34508 RepID=A0A4U5LQM4_STECR|nr:hypothetical protein L596_029738 [Steinernema carpocapsae]
MEFCCKSRITQICFVVAGKPQSQLLFLDFWGRRSFWVAPDTSGNVNSEDVAVRHAANRISCPPSLLFRHFRRSPQIHSLAHSTRRRVALGGLFLRVFAAHFFLFLLTAIDFTLCHLHRFMCALISAISGCACERNVAVNVALQIAHALDTILETSDSVVALRRVAAPSLDKTKQL